MISLRKWSIAILLKHVFMFCVCVSENMCAVDSVAAVSPRCRVLGEGAFGKVKLVSHVPSSHCALP